MTQEAVITFNPFDPAVADDPYPIYAAMRGRGPVVRSPLTSDAWMVSDDAGAVFLVTGYAEAVYVLEHPQLFTSGHKTGPEVSPEVLAELAAGFPMTSTLYNTDPPDHDRKRALVQAALSPQVVAADAGRIRATAGELISRFDPAGVDLLAEFVRPLARTALLDFIGFPRDEHDRVVRGDSQWEQLFIPGRPPEDERRGAQEVVAYQRYLESLVLARRDAPRGDLLSGVAAAVSRDGPALTMAEAVWCVMELYSAGHANTVDGLANVLVVLSEPDRWAALRADRTLVPAAVDEGLRLLGPVQWLPRHAARDVELAGVTIPAGATVMVLYAAANRDPRAFPEPDRFDPGAAGRSGPHVAYGHGIHYCVGAGWARVAIRSALEALLDECPGMRLRDGYQPSFYLPLPMLRCAAELPVVWTDTTHEETS